MLGKRSFFSSDRRFARLTGRLEEMGSDVIPGMQLQYGLTAPSCQNILYQFTTWRLVLIVKLPGNAFFGFDLPGLIVTPGSTLLTLFFLFSIPLLSAVFSVC